LTDREFYRLTPRQFHLLVDQHRERIQHQELLTGILASEIANRSMRPPDKWLPPSHFMPSRNGDEWEPGSRNTSGRINRKKIATKVRGFLEEQMKARVNG